MIWPAGGQNSIPWSLSAQRGRVVSHLARGLAEPGDRLRRVQRHRCDTFEGLQIIPGFLWIIADEITARAFEKHDVLIGRLGELNEFKRLLHPGMQASHERHDLYRHIRPFGYLSQVL